MIPRTGISALLVLSTLILTWSTQIRAQDKDKEEPKTPAIVRLLPLGIPQENVRLPEFAKGKGASLQLSSVTEADRMTRRDEKHIDLENLVLTRYTEGRQVEFRLLLETGVFQVHSRIISSDERSRVESPSFEMLGDSLLFHSDSRQGRMEGNVIMTVHDSGSLAGPMTALDEKKEPKPGDKPKESAPTVITTGPEGVAFVDAGKRIVIFRGDVHLDHPEFDVWCDELQLYLKDDEEPEPESVESTSLTDESPAPDAEPAVAPAPASNVGGVDIAVFLGRRVLLRKNSPEGEEDGELQVGQCRRATFYSETGSMFMQDFPQLQVGAHLFAATAPSTEIILRREGNHQIRGPHENHFVNEDPPKEKKTDPASPPAP